MSTRDQGVQQTELTQTIDNLMVAIVVLLGIALGRRARYLRGPLVMVKSQLGDWSAAVIGAASAQSAGISVKLILRMQALEERVKVLEAERTPLEHERGA